jgi:hypothetical protein
LANFFGENISKIITSVPGHPASTFFAILLKNSEYRVSSRYTVSGIANFLFEVFFHAQKALVIKKFLPSAKKIAKFCTKGVRYGALLVRIFYPEKLLVKIWEFTEKSGPKSLAFSVNFGRFLKKKIAAKSFWGYFSETNARKGRKIRPNGEIPPNLVTLLLPVQDFLCIEQTC